MNIALGKQFRDWIDEGIRSGRYGSETEAVEDALREKMERDEIESLRERVQRSEEQIVRGEYVIADDAYFDRLRERIGQRAADSRKG